MVAVTGMAAAWLELRGGDPQAVLQAVAEHEEQEAVEERGDGGYAGAEDHWTVSGEEFSTRRSCY